jgi:hypothetical protein
MHSHMSWEAPYLAKFYSKDNMWLTFLFPNILLDAILGTWTCVLNFLQW